MVAFNQMFHRVYQEIAQRKQAEEILRAEQEKSERLLLNILPEMIADRLKQRPDKYCRRICRGDGTICRYCRLYRNILPHVS